MPKLWLPLREPTTGREQIIYIPGAEHMDKSQLEEILQWQKEKTLADLKAKGPQRPPMAVAKRKEIGKALNEFRNYCLAKKEDPGHKMNWLGGF